MLALNVGGFLLCGVGVYSLRLGIAEKANTTVLGLGCGGFGLGIARRFIERTSCYKVAKTHRIP